MDFHREISEEQKEKIQQVFSTMMSDDIPDGYLAPESYKLAKEWLDNNKIGPFIDNKWIETSNRHTVCHACTGESLAEVSLASKETFDSAHNVGMEAFNTWKKDHLRRAIILRKIAQNLLPHAQLFSLLESIATGKPLQIVRSQDFPLLVQNFLHAAGLASTWDQDMSGWEPIGVAYIIASGLNYPMMSFCWQISTAFAAGNSVILQTDPECSLSASFLAQVMLKSGLDEGVFSLLPHKPILLSPWREIFFTGLYKDAEKLRQCVASTEDVTYLHIHAPFQRPNVVLLEGTDIDSAVEGILDLFRYANPHSNTAGCQVLVQESIAEKVTKKLKSRFQNLKVGDCLSNADVSFVKSNVASEHPTLEEIKKGGAKVLSLSHNAGLPFPPSLIYNLQTSSSIMHNPLQGHLILLSTFRTLKEVINICNHEKSGCDVSIWCEKLSAALQLAHSLKVANIWVNGQNIFDSTVSYGSVGRSGNAVFGGQRAVFQFVEPSYGDQPSRMGELRDTSGKNAICLNKVFKMYYAGSMRLSDSQALMAISDFHGKQICHVPAGSRKDIRNAVESAIPAQAKWQGRIIFSRGRILFSVAEGLVANAEMFSDVIQELTFFTRERCDKEVQLAHERLNYWASVCYKHSGELKDTEFGKVMQTQEPYGVIGIICPENVPLLAFVSLVAPALAMGNAVVVLPCETCPVPALKLCEVFDKCGLPGGVLNVITGSCESLADDLCKHMEVENIWVHRNCSHCHRVANNSHVYDKNVWYRSYMDHEFMSSAEKKLLILRSTYTKTIYLPMGDIFAN